MTFEEKTIKSDIVYEGPVFKIRKHIVDTVDGPSVRDVLEHGGGAVIIAVKDDGKIIMERQFRKPMEDVIWELPAGKRDFKEDSLETAKRELEEETGYVAGNIKHLLSYCPTCGYSNEILDIYICRNLSNGTKNLDPTECIDIVELFPDEIIDMIMKNEIYDSKTIIGILFARQSGEI